MILHLPLFCVCYDYNFRKGKANRFVFVDGYMKTELGSLTSIKTGKLDANASSENGIYPFFTCAVEPLKIDSYSYDCECVLVAGNGDLNVKYYNGKFDAYQRTYIIESKDKSKLTVPYLYYFLESYIETLRSQSIGGIIKYIKIGNLTNASIPILSIEKQNKIVKTLDKAKSIITHLRTQLEKLDLLVKARFVEMFGDIYTNKYDLPICPLSDYITFLTSGSRGWAKYCTENGTDWFITIKNVKACKITTHNIQQLNAPDNMEAKRTKVQEDDLLISITADLGRTGVVTKEIAEHGAYINQHLTCVRLNKSKITPIYAAYFMESNSGRPQFEAKNQTGVKAGLNFDSIKSLKISVPPLTLQNQFADFVKQIDKSKSILQQELDKAQMLFDSLMQEYFG